VEHQLLLIRVVVEMVVFTLLVAQLLELLTQVAVVVENLVMVLVIHNLVAQA
jgi:hypothetical protein